MTAYELTPTCKVNLLEQLGRGASGIVYLGKLNKIDTDGKQNKTDVAVKCLQYMWNTDFSSSDSDSSMVTRSSKKYVNNKIQELGLKEITIFKRLGNNHKNIVRFYDFKDDGSSIWIIMEYCNLGTLSDYLTKYQPDLRAKLRIMKECTEAIMYMHSLNPPLLHYDIKPSNILLKENNGMHVVKITDFAGSGILGTKVFMAPELQKKRKDDLYNLDRKSSDIFSLGLVFYVVISYSEDHPHVVPITNKMKENSFGEEMLHAVENSLLPPELFDYTNQPPDVITAKIQRLIIYMTQYRPLSRMDITDVLTHLKLADSEYRRTDGEETRVGRGLDSSADLHSLDRQISDSAIDVPEACKAPHVELQGCTALIHWEPPHTDRTAPITGFIIEQQWLNSYGWLKTHEVDGNTFDCCIEGLMRGYKYQFCVTAANKRGVGKRGLSSHVVETIGSLGQVENLQVFDITQNYCRLRWSPPCDSGDSAILEYVIEQNCGNRWTESGRVSGNTLHYKVTSVEEGRSYTFRLIPKSGPSTYATSGMVLIQGEGDDNKQMEQSCNSAVLNVNNIIAAVQNAQQSPSDLNLRVFAYKLKSITENALLEVQIACDIVNKRLIDIDIQFKILNEKSKTAVRDCNRKGTCLVKTQEKHEKARERIRRLKTGLYAWLQWDPLLQRSISYKERDAAECESELKSITNEIKSLETEKQTFAKQIETTVKKFKDECDTLFLMNVFCNYVTIVAKTLETFQAKLFYDMYLIISPLQDLVDFISSDEFTCADSLQMKNGISEVVCGMKNLQSLVIESPLSRETQQLQKQKRQLELLVQVRGTFLLRRLLQKQVLDTWGHELALLLQDTSAGVIVKSGPGKDVIHKFKEHINKIKLSDEETINLNSRNMMSFDITLLSKLLKVPEISGIGVSQDSWNDYQSQVQMYYQWRGFVHYRFHEEYMHVTLAGWICVVIHFRNEIHNKTHMNLSKREIETRVDNLSNALTGLTNYVGISEEEMKRHEDIELLFSDPHIEARQQVRAATRNMQLEPDQKFLQETERSHNIGMDIRDASQVNIAYWHPCLQDNKAILERDLDLRGELLDYLYMDDVISRSQYKKLWFQAGEGDMRKLLLHCVDIRLMVNQGRIGRFITALYCSGDANSALAESLRRWCRDNGYDLQTRIQCFQH